MRATLLLWLPMLFLVGLPERVRAEEDLGVAARAAVAKSLTLLERSPATYIKERTCFSCHHQALPAMAVGLARERGFKVNPEGARAQSAFTQRYFAERAEEVRLGKGIPGGPYSAGYALVALGTDRWPADQTTKDLVHYLLQTQEQDGRWRIRTHRPPLEDSDFTATAVAVRGLALSGSVGREEEIKRQTEGARRWLEKAKTTTHEDKVFRLFGLKWSGADEAVLRAAAEALLGEQREDGGWGQLAGLDSDAYATGQALVVLHQAGGLAVSHTAYRRGVSFLLKQQLDDGSWLVKSRSRPFQKYFESGFPHKENQWISICATSWATMALSLLRTA